MKKPRRWRRADPANDTRRPFPDRPRPGAAYQTSPNELSLVPFAKSGTCAPNKSARAARDEWVRAVDDRGGFGVHLGVGF